ncbi:hypothetical protein GLA29479_3857 [Lysobacter antibioticus]|uniref:hypothetical protein n=1 Tax=Lysobacter antibioticus TaxID=84531 RepID=UPI000721F86C|nr:hypothetical protein [Lysobacter antibioticus]ALN64708.1 hypothetical protein GLA29479_3857 [Lysobacter antibioticus]
MNHKPARSMPTQGFFIRDIHVPMKNGPHPCGPPSGSSIILREYEATHSNSNSNGNGKVIGDRNLADTTTVGAARAATTERTEIPPPSLPIEA